MEPGCEESFVVTCYQCDGLICKEHGSKPNFQKGENLSGDQNYICSTCDEKLVLRQADSSANMSLQIDHDLHCPHCSSVFKDGEKNICENCKAKFVEEKMAENGITITKYQAKGKMNPFCLDSDGRQHTDEAYQIAHIEELSAIRIALFQLVEIEREKLQLEKIEVGVLNNCN